MRGLAISVLSVSILLFSAAGVRDASAQRSARPEKSEKTEKNKAEKEQKVLPGLPKELQVNKTWVRKYKDFTGTDSGLCKVLYRFHHRPDAPEHDFSRYGIDGGGCYWSFSRQTHDYQNQPQVGLNEVQTGWAENDEPVYGAYFKSAFYGHSIGMTARLSTKSIRDTEIEDAPADLTSYEQCDHDRDLEALKKLEEKWSKADAEVGGVYAVRVVLWGESDVLAVFEVLDKDDEGMTLAWKILKTYPVPVDGDKPLPKPEQPEKKSDEGEIK